MFDYYNNLDPRHPQNKQSITRTLEHPNKIPSTTLIKTNEKHPKIEIKKRTNNNPSKTTSRLDPKIT